MTFAKRSVAAGVFTCLLAGGCGAADRTAAEPPDGAPPPTAGPFSPDQFYAVLLDNGSLYYGKIETSTSQYLLLREVYYAQRRVNEQTKTVTSIFIRRGSELHGPDRMFISPSAITLIEPIGANSKLAELIARASQEPPPSPEPPQETRP